MYCLLIYQALIHHYNGIILIEWRKGWCTDHFTV